MSETGEREGSHNMSLCRYVVPIETFQSDRLPAGDEEPLSALSGRGPRILTKHPSLKQLVSIGRCLPASCHCLAYDINYLLQRLHSNLRICAFLFLVRIFALSTE